MSKFAFYASGFRETRGQANGTRQNAHLIRSEFQASSIVRYVEWDDNPRGYAADLVDQWVTGDTVTVEGYSWGCGNWIHKFLHSLFKLAPQIRVQHLTLIDPVIHTTLFSLRWFAVTDWGKIRFPDNIDRAFVFYQKKDEPNASGLVFDGCISAAYSELDYGHTSIDNAHEVTSRTLAVARRWLV